MTRYFLRGFCATLSVLAAHCTTAAPGVTQEPTPSPLEARDEGPVGEVEPSNQPVPPSTKPTEYSPFKKTQICINYNDSHGCPSSPTNATGIFNSILDDPSKVVLPAVEVPFDAIAAAMEPYLPEKSAPVEKAVASEFVAAAVSPVPAGLDVDCKKPGQSELCCPENHLGDLDGKRETGRWTAVEPYLPGANQEFIQQRIQKCIDLCNEKQRNREDGLNNTLSCSESSSVDEIRDTIGKINKLLEIEFKYYDWCFSGKEPHPGTGTDPGHAKKWGERIVSLLKCWRLLDKKLIPYLTPEFLIRDILTSDWYEELVLGGEFNKAPYNELIPIVGRPSPPTVQPVKPKDPPSGFPEGWWIIGCPTKESTKCVIQGGVGAVAEGAAAASFWFFINPELLKELYSTQPVINPPPA